MSQDKIVYLMYHELELPNRYLCNQEKGYTRYVLHKSDFYSQIQNLSNRGFIGLNVSQGCSFSNYNSNGVVITFDDGCETDLIAAAPILKEFHFNATFYVVANFLGKPGYLSNTQLRELSDLGFEIGSHSMTHSFLSDLSKDDLYYEILQSKNHLEQILGKSINHFSCPGGRWSKLAAQISKESGYLSMVTSRIGSNHKKSDRFALSRICVQRNTSLPEFDKFCRAKGIGSRQACDKLYTFSKTFLGNELYEKVRNHLLSQSTE